MKTTMVNDQLCHIRKIEFIRHNMPSLAEIPKIDFGSTVLRTTIEQILLHTI